MSQSWEQLSAAVPGTTPALMQWVRTQVAAGHPQAALQQQLQETGWSAVVAHAAITACSPFATSVPLAAHSHTPAAMPVLGMPSANLQGQPSTIDVGDRHVQVLMAMAHPHVVVFANLLSASECEALIADARPAMARSRTVATHRQHQEISLDRTSQGMFFTRGQTPVVERLERRIAHLLQWPMSHGEGLQVLHYLPGAQYKPHHDYFNPQEPSTPALLQRGGQRIGTLLVYLNDVAQGGCTIFPESQLRIQPRQGHAVFFAYASPDPSTRTLHGGEPVIAGEKWIATKWLRERAFH